MAITHWPREERPREKLIAQGAQALSDAELLAVFLRSGVSGCTAVDVARRLLQRFGGVRQLLNAELRELCTEPGVGPVKYVQLQAAIELGRRYLAQRLARGTTLTSPSQARDYLHAQLRDRPYEAFCCLYLDTRHRVLGFEELFRGTLDGASVHPRELIRVALTRCAAAVIVAHNHPSGVAEPSSADEALTLRLKQALALVDIRLLDHIVIGDGDSVSFSERGLL